MANTTRESTAPFRSEDPSDLGRLFPLPSQEDEPLTYTPLDSAFQEGGWPTPPVIDPLISPVLSAVDMALALHSRNGGSTVKLIDGDMAGQKLFAVSIYPERAIELAAPPSQQQLFDFTLANLHLFVKPDHALGTWFNKLESVHVLDVVVCTPDRETAFDLGMRFNQWSIFDLAAGQEIQIAPTASIHWAGQSEVQP